MSKEGSTLRSYVIRRILQAIPLILVAIIINFILIHAAPGDPVYFIAGEFATAEYVDFLRQRFGLDKPLHEQLVIYIFNVIQGDLGYSIINKQPVFKLITERLPATLILLVPSLLIASSIGIILGINSARKQYSLTDNLTTVVSLVAYCIPIFWLGQIFILFFSIRLGWTPVQGMLSPRLDLTGIKYILDIMRHLILPTLTLSAVQLPLITRMTRAKMLEVLELDFVLTARMKGLSENKIIYKHVLRNTMLSLITIIGMSFTGIFTGAVLTETVFAWPGLGRLMYASIGARDYPTILGMLVFVSIAVTLVNLITDIIYGILDPRIRYR